MRRGSGSAHFLDRRRRRRITLKCVTVKRDLISVKRDLINAKAEYYFKMCYTPRIPPPIHDCDALGVASEGPVLTYVHMYMYTCIYVYM
jgi:hypothetical protein